MERRRLLRCVALLECRRAGEPSVQVPLQLGPFCFTTRFGLALFVLEVNNKGFFVSRIIYIHCYRVIYIYSGWSGP